MNRGEEIVRERIEVYGDPLPNMEEIAGRWSEVFGFEVRPSQVCTAMICLKEVREENGQHLQDNIDDIQGYNYIRKLCLDRGK